MSVKILALSGSSRAESLNRKLVLNASRGAENYGAKVTLLDWNEMDLPIYGGDLEKSEGVPEKAQNLITLFNDHDGFLISTPEYNGAFSGLLKNAIDWVSRFYMLESKPPHPFKNKIAGIMSASPGALGGIRGLPHLRVVLSGLGTLVIPEQLALSKAGEAFGDDDILKDEKMRATAEGIGARTAEVIQKLSS